MEVMDKYFQIGFNFV